MGIRYLRAPAAVQTEITRIRPDLKGKWRGVVPKDLGLEPDDWLELSQMMVDRFAESIHKSVKFPDAARAKYRTQRLTEFVVALANLGDAAMASPLFRAAGFRVAA